MRNYRAVIAYDGTDYSGFQVQRDRPTIQGEIESALERVTQNAARIAGAGRTDSGVHAVGQVISFGSCWAHDPAVLQRALNAVLPKSISVREMGVARHDFHARYSAQSRVYRYQFYTCQVRIPVLDRHALCVTHSLSLELLQRATGYLLGGHDFQAFGQPPVGTNTFRTVHRAEWREVAGDAQCLWPAGAVGGLAFEIEADAFLRGMVRRLVGTLLWIGQGRLSPTEFQDILHSRQISRSAPPAAARGLCLWHVNYADELSRRQHRVSGCDIAQG